MSAGPPGHLAILPPAAKLLGREILASDAAAGTAHLKFHAPPEFANRHGTVQGGLQSAMLDSACATAVHGQSQPGETALTMTLKTAFLRPAPLGDLFAKSRIVARDGRSAEVEAELTTPTGETVATATATFRIRLKAN